MESIRLAIVSPLPKRLCSGSHRSTDGFVNILWYKLQVQESEESLLWSASLSVTLPYGNVTMNFPSDIIQGVADRQKEGVTF